MRHLVRWLPLALAACRSAQPTADYGPVVTRFEPPTRAAGAPVASAPILASPGLSLHAVTAAGPIRPHYHALHEETVYVVAGRARMRIGDAWHEIGPGSIVHVPTGVVHAVEPLEPCTVLSIFAPPFDGGDRVFVD